MAPTPDELHAALTYFSQLKEQLERDAAGRLGSSGVRALPLREVCDLYFSHNPRKVAPATIARDRINANNLCRLIPSDLRPDELDEPA
ncbi:MAG: hypothetical protein JWO97_2160, partial [Acidobacteria bacterium]|nr:hypothetical protein [Acidobacteriota bacterium]